MITPLAGAEDAAVYGGKAVQLGTAIRNGLPVPSGYALSVSAVEAIIEGHTAALGAIAAVAEELGLLAVRSSALDEDSAEASFAGAHLSVLAVSGSRDTVAAVRAVHESATNAGALSYRANRGLDADGRMAVVVQRLVDADTAGVLFTRNPVTGAEERVIEASWGLGEAVVAGIVTPDHYRVSRGGSLLDRTPGRKDVSIRPRRDPRAAEATEEVPVAPELVDAFCLDDTELTALDHLAGLCDDAYGTTEHDIEFAFHDGQVFLLQRRPITRA